MSSSHSEPRIHKHTWKRHTHETIFCSTYHFFGTFEPSALFQKLAYSKPNYSGIGGQVGEATNRHAKTTVTGLCPRALPALWSITLRLDENEEQFNFSLELPLKGSICLPNSPSLLTVSTRRRPKGPWARNPTALVETPDPHTAGVTPPVPTDVATQTEQKGWLVKRTHACMKETSERAEAPGPSGRLSRSPFIRQLMKTRAMIVLFNIVTALKFHTTVAWLLNVWANPLSEVCGLQNSIGASNGKISLIALVLRDGNKFVSRLHWQSHQHDRFHLAKGQ